MQSAVSPKDFDTMKTDNATLLEKLKRDARRALIHQVHIILSRCQAEKKTRWDASDEHGRIHKGKHKKM